MFENEGAVLLSEEHGKKIIDWANSGEGFNVEVKKFDAITANGSVTNDERLNDKKNELKSLIDSIINNGVSRDEVADTIKSHYILNGKASANYTNIKDVKLLDEIIEDLKSIIK